MKQRPLYDRIYQTPAWYSLIRLLGYAEHPLEDARKLTAPLADQYGLHVMQEAAAVLTEGNADKTTVRLRPEVRKLAWQLLGPPPEDPGYEAYWQGRERPAMPAEAQPKPKRRSRKKAG